MRYDSESPSPRTRSADLAITIPQMYEEHRTARKREYMRGY
jgi:hypothetical protein